MITREMAFVYISLDLLDMPITILARKIYGGSFGVARTRGIIMRACGFSVWGDGI